MTLEGLCTPLQGLQQLTKPNTLSRRVTATEYAARDEEEPGCSFLTRHRAGNPLCTSFSPLRRFHDFGFLVFGVPPGTLDRPATVLLDDGLELFESKLPFATGEFRGNSLINARAITKVYL